MDGLTTQWIIQIVIMIFLFLSAVVFFYIIWLAIKALRKYLREERV
jgi:threonine/homoserine/homoserine lactone efflux protein